MTKIEELAQELAKLPPAQQDAVAAHLMGVMQGMILQAGLDDKKAG